MIETSLGPNNTRVSTPGEVKVNGSPVTDPTRRLRRMDHLRSVRMEARLPVSEEDGTGTPIYD